MRVDEAPVGQRDLELAAQLAHIDVDRAVADAQLAPPYVAVQILARDNGARSPGHRGQELELSDGQGERATGCEHKALLEPDLELAGIEDVSGDIRALQVGRHDAERRRR